MKGKNGLIYVGALTMAAALSSCSGNECYDNHSALPLAYFYDASTMQQVSMQRLEIYGVGAPGDSVLYTPQNLNQAYLPFRLWEDTTTYVFAYYGMLNVDEGGEEEGNEKVTETISVPSDTVSFIYNRKEWFVSPACGAMYFYEMKKVEYTDLLIDSISCNELITNENTVNMKIFFKPAVADE